MVRLDVGLLDVAFCLVYVKRGFTLGGVFYFALLFLFRISESWFTFLRL